MIAHIIGAGVAGLASAVSLAKLGGRVVVYDTANHAGGRARSFYDKTLDRVIDNGNHLMLGANSAVFAYLDDIGAHNVVDGPALGHLSVSEARPCIPRIPCSG